MTMDLLLFTNMFFHLSQQSLLPDLIVYMSDTMSVL